MVRDQIVTPITQRSGNQPGNGAKPPPTAESAGEFDHRITAGEYAVVGFTHQDHGPAGLGCVGSKTVLRSEFSLQWREGNPLMSVESRRTPDRGRAERAVPIEKQYPTHAGSLNR